jgi:hypothetical protein
MDKTVRIYILRDPRDGEVRYVGKTVHKLSDRLRGHVCDAKRQKSRVSNWIKVLSRVGLRPIVEQIEEAAGDWAVRESYWIAFYRKLVGDKLTNLTDGGDGAHGRRPNAATLEKMSATHKARYTDPEERRRTGESVRSALSNPEWSAEQSARLRRRWAMPGAKEAQSEKLRAASSSETAKAKRSESGRKAWTLERREAARERLRATANLRWARVRSEKLASLALSKSTRVQRTADDPSEKG